MKKNILVVFGIGDTFCDESSPRCIKRGKSGPVLAKDIKSLISNGSDDMFGFVSIKEPSDTNFKVDALTDVNKSRIIEHKLCSRSVFNLNNQISVPGSEDDSETILDGNQLDHILPPEEYKLFVSGIDINGIFNSFIDEASELGYEIVVYSNAIKPLNKETINHIVSSSKNRRKNVSFRKG